MPCKEARDLDWMTVYWIQDLSIVHNVCELFHGITGIESKLDHHSFLVCPLHHVLLGCSHPFRWMHIHDGMPHSLPTCSTQIIDCALEHLLFGIQKKFRESDMDNISQVEFLNQKQDSTTQSPHTQSQQCAHCHVGISSKIVCDQPICNPLEEFSQILDELWFA